jgi:hypothetical protein
MNERRDLQTSTAPDSDDQLANYKFVKGANWDSDNVRTLLQWIHISAIYLDVLIFATEYYRRIIRRHTILNLILSTLASTVSLSQFNIAEADYPQITIMLKILFSTSTIIIALSAGFIKVYQIQERLEKSLQLQQEWTTFGSKITSEMQLPVNLRTDALYVIIKLKEVYSNLVKQQSHISRKFINRVAKSNGIDAKDLTLSDLFERILRSEAERINITFDSVAGIDAPIVENNDKKPFNALIALFKNKRKITIIEDRSRVSNAILSPSNKKSSASHINNRLIEEDNSATCSGSGSSINTAKSTIGEDDRATILYNIDSRRNSSNGHNTQNQHNNEIVIDNETIITDITDTVKSNQHNIITNHTTEPRINTDLVKKQVYKKSISASSAKTESTLKAYLQNYKNSDLDGKPIH